MSDRILKDSAGTPAEYGDTVQVVKDKLGQFDAVQESASLKPVLGRVPVGGRRNLWVNSDNLFTFRRDADIVETDLLGPDGVSKVYKWKPDFREDPGSTAFSQQLFRGINTSGGELITQSIYIKPINAISRYPNPPDTSEADRQVRLTLSQDAGQDAMLNLHTMQIESGAERAFLEDLEDGWYRFGVTYIAGSDSGNNQFFAFGNRTDRHDFDPAPSGEEEMLIAAPQVEYAKFLDSPPTPFQKVVSSVDVYEPGAEHIEYLRFDGVDDRMSHTFPDGFEGDLIVCGTKGSWIDEGVSVPAGGELTIGPKNLPNTPNILPALGDIIGWVPVSRTTTEEERQRIIEYYKGRGAKGRLVPSGVEILVADGNNFGDFDAAEDIQKWFGSGGGQIAHDVENQSMVISTEGYYYGYARTYINGLLEGDKPYVFKVTLGEIGRTSHNPYIGVWKGNLDAGAQQRLSFNAPGVYEMPFIAYDDGQQQFRIYTGGIYSSVTVDSVSIQELIPEEDLS